MFCVFGLTSCKFKRDVLIVIGIAEEINKPVQLHYPIYYYNSVTGKEFFSMRQWPFIIQNQCDILKTNVTFSNSNVTYPKITRICTQL